MMFVLTTIDLNLLSIKFRLAQSSPFVRCGAVRHTESSSHVTVHQRAFRWSELLRCITL